MTRADVWVLCYIRIMVSAAGAPWWGEYLAQYHEASRFVRGCKVLDIGCGAGHGTRYLFDHGAVECLGVDVNGQDILTAQKENGRDGVSFIAADAKNLPFEPRSFDLITCFQVLESTTSCDQVMDQIKRLVRPEGTVLLSTVNRRRDQHLALTPAALEHIQEFDRDEFKYLLKKNFAHCEIMGLSCHRTRNKTLEFVKNQLENRIPWKLREAFSKRVFGTSFYPAAGDYSLVNPSAEEVPLFFAVCKL